MFITFIIIKKIKRTPNCESSFALLQDKVNELFRSAIFGGDISQLELCLFILPARMGGMGDNDSVETAGAAFLTSRTFTDVKGKADFSVFDCIQQMSQAKKEMPIATLSRMSNKGIYGI